MPRKRKGSVGGLSNVSRRSSFLRFMNERNLPLKKKEEKKAPPPPPVVVTDDPNDNYGNYSGESSEYEEYEQPGFHRYHHSRRRKRSSEGVVQPRPRRIPKTNNNNNRRKSQDRLDRSNVLKTLSICMVVIIGSFTILGLIIALNDRDVGKTEKRKK